MGPPLAQAHQLFFRLVSGGVRLVPPWAPDYSINPSPLYTLPSQLVFLKALHSHPLPSQETTFSPCQVSKLHFQFLLKKLFSAEVSEVCRLAFGFQERRGCVVRLRYIVHHFSYSDILNYISHIIC